MSSGPVLHRFTRQELYDLVWSMPIRQLAPHYEMSNVAFAKHCRRHDVPLPPLGYWAKVKAGKAAAKTPLPPRAVGIGEFVEIGHGADQWLFYGDPPNLIHREIPPPPTFTETIEEVRARVAADVGAVTIPPGFDSAHRLIARLLAEDEVRRRKQREDMYPSLDAPRFDSPFEQRRLRLLNAVFLALERAGHKPMLRAKDPSDFDVKVGGQRVSFFLDHPDQERASNKPTSAPDRPATDTLSFEISAWRQSGELSLVWRDKRQDLAEHHVGEIVATLIVAAEVQYRQGVLARFAWLTERKAKLQEHARKREEEKQRRARERRIKAQQDRVDRLLTEAKALRQALDIRSYVELVRARNEATADPLPANEVDAWASWALAQADRIDPVLSGRFLDYDAGGSSDEEE